jgi:hypothetical protein
MSTGIIILIKTQNIDVHLFGAKFTIIIHHEGNLNDAHTNYL